MDTVPTHQTARDAARRLRGAIIQAYEAAGLAETGAGLIKQIERAPLQYMSHESQPVRKYATFVFAWHMQATMVSGGPQFVTFNAKLDALKHELRQVIGLAGSADV